MGSMTLEMYTNLKNLGFFQEINRKFLHCIGLSLEVQVDPTTKQVTLDLIDGRDDDEGFILKAVDEQQQKVFWDFQNDKHLKRIKGLGYIFQASESMRYL